LDNKIKNEIPNGICAFCESNLNNNDNNNDNNRDDNKDDSSNYDDNDKSSGNTNSRPSSIPSSIQRIVLSNRSSGAVFFNHHFKEWWLTGELKPRSNKESIKAFGNFEKLMDRSNKSRMCIYFPYPPSCLYWAYLASPPTTIQILLIYGKSFDI
jgi:hypothetical protein